MSIFGYLDLDHVRALPDTASLFADQQQHEAYLATLEQIGYVQGYP